MKDLTIINGQNEKFALVDTEIDNYSLKAFYVSVSNYKEGFFDDDDLIEIHVDYEYQLSDCIHGWCGSDYDQPNYTSSQVYPGDDEFDYDQAKEVALEVANEMILQHDIAHGIHV